MRGSRRSLFGGRATTIARVGVSLLRPPGWQSGRGCPSAFPDHAWPEDRKSDRFRGRTANRLQRRTLIGFFQKNRDHFSKENG